MDYEITHVRIVDGALRDGLPGFVGLPIAWKDAYDIEFLNVRELHVGERFQFAAKHEVEKLLGGSGAESAATMLISLLHATRGDLLAMQNCRDRAARAGLMPLPAILRDLSALKPFANNSFTLSLKPFGSLLCEGDDARPRSRRLLRS